MQVTKVTNQPLTTEEENARANLMSSGAYPDTLPRNLQSGGPSNNAAAPQQFAQKIHVDVNGIIAPAIAGDAFFIRFQVMDKVSASLGNPGKKYYKAISCEGVDADGEYISILNNVWLGWLGQYSADMAVYKDNSGRRWIDSHARIAVSGSHNNPGRLYWSLNDGRYKGRDYVEHFISWADETLKMELVCRKSPQNKDT